MIPFISDDDLSAYLGQTVSEADLDVVIALDAACQTVRDMIRRSVNLVADDEITMDGNGAGVLLLPQRPVAEVTEVSVDGTLLDPTEYDLLGDQGTLRLTTLATIGTWTPGISNVAITYTHGWALSEDDVTPDPPVNRVPSSIRLVALRLAAAVWLQHHGAAGTTPAGATSETIGGYSYSVDSAAASLTAAISLTPEDRASLAPWVDARAA